MFAPPGPFQFSLMFVGMARSLSLEWSTRKVIHLGKLQPETQTLERPARNKHSSLLLQFVIYEEGKVFLNNAPGFSVSLAAEKNLKT